jgi:hypothetical protein
MVAATVIDQVSVVAAQELASVRVAQESTPDALAEAGGEPAMEPEKQSEKQPE